MPAHSRVIFTVIAAVFVLSAGAQQALAQAATVAIEVFPQVPAPMTIDMARSHPAWRQQQSGLYVLHGSRQLVERLRQAGHRIPQNGLLYVGKAKDLASRIGKHLRGNPQNSSFAKTLRAMLPGDSYVLLIRGLKVSMLPVADPAVRGAMERRLIAALQPQLNRMGMPAREEPEAAGAQDGQSGREEPESAVQSGRHGHGASVGAGRRRHLAKGDRRGCRDRNAADCSRGDATRDERAQDTPRRARGWRPRGRCRRAGRCCGRRCANRRGGHAHGARCRSPRDRWRCGLPLDVG